jgi:hypothetical protein
MDEVLKDSRFPDFEKIRKSISESSKSTKGIASQQAFERYLYRKV